MLVAQLITRPILRPFHALEVIGAHVATLVDTRLSAALDSDSEDEVRCLVARAVTPKLAQLIVVAVRGARPGMHRWKDEAAGAAARAATGNFEQKAAARLVSDQCRLV